MNGGLQELEETAYWMELLMQSNTIPVPKLSPLYEETRGAHGDFRRVHPQRRAP
jgi:hypothetical protein